MELAGLLVSSVGELAKGGVLLAERFWRRASFCWREDGGRLQAGAVGLPPGEQRAAFSPLLEGRLGWTVLGESRPQQPARRSALLPRSPLPLLRSFCRLRFP